MTNAAMWPQIVFYFHLFFNCCKLGGISSSWSSVALHSKLHGARCLWSKAQPAALHQPQAGVSDLPANSKSSCFICQVQVPGAGKAVMRLHGSQTTHCTCSFQHVLQRSINSSAKRGCREGEPLSHFSKTISQCSSIPRSYEISGWRRSLGKPRCRDEL